MEIIRPIKNLFKKRYYLLVFICIILIYTFISFIYFNLNKTDSNLDSSSNLDNDLSDFKDRIEKLENVLIDLKKNANDLNDLFKKTIEEADNAEKNSKNNRDDRIGVLVMACNRPSVSFHLEQLLANRKYNENKFPIVVSQDCNHENTKTAILNYKSSLHAFIEQPDQSTPTDNPPPATHLVGYYKISRHYKWALDQMFMNFSFNSVIITEDDLNLAPDFFQYFDALNKILVYDKTLYCVSAWNDNGKIENIKNDPELLHRTDFFPGLGWMLTREFWLEIRDKWPKAYWDDWMRKSEIRNDRSCIRPEISRTEISPKGKMGVSNGQFFDKYLKYIVVNKKPVNWLEKDLTYLVKIDYDRHFDNEVFTPNSVDIDFQSYINRERDEIAKEQYDSSSKLRIKYITKQDFEKIARYFGIMDDFRAGVARTAYKGVVRVYRDSKDIYITPAEPWNGYNKDWS